MIQENFTIQKNEAGIRIEVLSAKKFPHISRTHWQKNGSFESDGVAKPGKTKTREGETWTVQCEEENTEPQNIVPWDFPLKVLKESKTWVAIEKPAGISVHPSPSERTNQTIVNALIHQFGKNLSVPSSSFPLNASPRPGIVHRLDKITSGVLLVAKTNETHRYLQEHWKKVKKTYYAIVETHHGVSLPQKGKIEAGITRHHQNRQKMTVSKDEKAKEAETYFETIKTWNTVGTRYIASLKNQDTASLLKITIPTGRTHQIRVHLSSIGYPILGDVKYGGIAADRVYLHAERLVFPDLDKKGEMQEVVSVLPETFQDKSM